MLYDLNNAIIILISILFSIFFFLQHQKIANFFKLIDKPNHRKKHINHVAITGGLGLIIITVSSFCLLSFIEIQDYFFVIKEKNLGIIIFSSLIFFIGVCDDRYEIKPINKLILTFIVYILFLNINPEFLIKEINFSWSNHTLDLKNFSFVFTLICFVVYLQIVNMFDGVNLQCSLYSIFLFLIFYIILKNTFFLILISYLIIFSYFNFKNKSFLGDGGNYLISFYVSISLVYAQNNYLISSDHIVFLLLIPVLDLFRLFFIRIRLKKSIFMPDRNHIHHYLLEKFRLNNVLLGYVIYLLIMTCIFILSNEFIFLLSIILFIIFYCYLIIFLRQKN
jgi:UDP-GlcNAc:undecaprenyl-phosphate/decaprenyl-phosphate GlcNAc-1-phosphate transferase